MLEIEVRASCAIENSSSATCDGVAIERCGRLGDIAAVAMCGRWLPTAPVPGGVRDVYLRERSPRSLPGQEALQQLGERPAHQTALEPETIAERLGLGGRESLKAAAEVADERLGQEDVADQRVDP
jgi:hypothetical protein